MECEMVDFITGFGLGLFLISISVLVLVFSVVIIKEFISELTGR